MKFEPPLFHPNSTLGDSFFLLVPRLASLEPILNINATVLTASAVSALAPALFPVYPDGNVCISILHTPGDDPLMYEQASERWSPVQSVEKVLLSVISMLAGMCFTSRFVTR